MDAVSRSSRTAYSVREWTRPVERALLGSVSLLVFRLAMRD